MENNGLLYLAYNELVDLIYRRICDLKAKHWTPNITSITINFRYRSDFYKNLMLTDASCSFKDDFFLGYKINWSHNPKVIFRINRKRPKRQKPLPTYHYGIFQTENGYHKGLRKNREETKTQFIS